MQTTSSDSDETKIAGFYLNQGTMLVVPQQGCCFELSLCEDWIYELRLSDREEVSRYNCHFVRQIVWQELSDTSLDKEEKSDPNHNQCGTGVQEGTIEDYLKSFSFSGELVGQNPREQLSKHNSLKQNEVSTDASLHSPEQESQELGQGSQEMVDV